MEGTSDDGLLRDVKAVVAEAEGLLAAAGDRAGDVWGDARHELEVLVRKLRERAGHAEAVLRATAQEKAEATDRYVHENPWPVIAGAAALGVALGMLIGRR